MDALKKSVAQAGGENAEKPAARKMAPSGRRRTTSTRKRKSG